MPSLLEELGKKYRPAKIFHNYLPLYSHYFDARRLGVRKVLEIGVGGGAKSLRMWEEYFPNAQIYGMDIQPQFAEYEKGRVKVIIGDQKNKNDLIRLPEDLDIVIDDGCHHQPAQVETFERLFASKLKSGGIYVVEDILDRWETIHHLKNLVDNVNYIPPENLRTSLHLNAFPEEANWWDRHLLGISFYRHIAFVFKGKNPEEGEAAYRLAQRKGRAQLL